jgi:hypothetical protein
MAASGYFPAFAATLTRMEGKIGCTSGTGFVCALGGRGIMINRDSTRAREALSALRTEFSEVKVERIDCNHTIFSVRRKPKKQVHFELSRNKVHHPHEDQDTWRYRYNDWVSAPYHDGLWDGDAGAMRIEELSEEATAFTLWSDIETKAMQLLEIVWGGFWRCMHS